MTIVKQDFWRAPEAPFKGSFRRFSPLGSGQDTLFCSSSISRAEFPSAVMRQDAVLWGHLLRIGHRLLQRILARTVRHWKPWLMSVRAQGLTLAPSPNRSVVLLKRLSAFFPPCVATILTYPAKIRSNPGKKTYLSTFLCCCFHKIKKAPSLHALELFTWSDLQTLLGWFQTRGDSISWLNSCQKLGQASNMIQGHQVYLIW